MGVGHQIWTPRLIERFEHVTTVEHSQLLLDELGSRMKASNWEPVCADFEEYRPAHAFDAILATYVLEHVTDPVKQLSVMRGWLSEAFEALTERERMIITARKMGETPETLESLGIKLRLSKERVRQLEAQALRKMRQPNSC